jgi:hypothetical protein
LSLHSGEYFLKILAINHQLSEFLYVKSSLQLRTIIAKPLPLIDLFESGSIVMASLFILALSRSSLAEVCFAQVQVSSTAISIS